MFIAIVGTECSGKSTIRDYLVVKGFKHVLPSNQNQRGTSKSGLGTLLETRATIFASESSLLNHVTQNWREDFVTTSLCTKQALEPFMKRPFFLLLVVDAPVTVRWKRSLKKRANASQDLEAFVKQNDRLVYGAPESVDCGTEKVNGIRIGSTDVVGSSTLSSIPEILHDILRSLVHVSIVNSFPTVAMLHAHLDTLDLMDTERLRPSWDSYFMTLAHLASLRSNCMKRRVGAILVRNNRVVSTGYNGTPRGLKNCNEGGCRRCNGTAKSGESLDECLCLHAEENALLEAGRERVGDGAVLYCNTCPCLRCSVKIVQTGVRRVVYNLGYYMDEASAAVFREAGVDLRQHSPP